MAIATGSPRAAWASLACLVGVACSPGRIGSGGETSGGSGTELGAEVGSEESGGPSVDTGSEAETDGGDDDGGSPWGGGCDGDAAGSLKWLDICEPKDPCDTTSCAGDQVCLGGLCIEPMPPEPCVGVALVALELDVDFSLTSSSSSLLLADVDGLAGDELISTGNGVLEVARTGELLVSEVLPPGIVNEIQALQLGGDDHLDLLVHSYSYQDDFTLLLSGDGDGRFSEALVQLPFDLVTTSPFALDFDNDGDDDLFAWNSYVNANQVYRNEIATLSLAGTFDVEGHLGRPVDLDLDGFVDDVLLGDYPSPVMLVGEGGELIGGGALPEPSRGANLEYGIGAPFVADLDGDGFVEVLSVLADNFGRFGIRVWWGLPDLEFEAPRDQLWFASENPYVYESVTLVGFAELDGVAPVELLVRGPKGLSYARPDLDNRLPFACAGSLLEPDLNVAPAIGDLDADGWPEIAVRSGSDLELWGVAQAP